MPDFQYTTVPGKLSALLDKMRTIGVPPKATTQWLKSIGFKSSNDGTLLTVLKAIGFTDSNGAPSESWRNYRGADHKAVLAQALRSSYRQLFEVYPEAWQRNDTELEHFFSTRSNAGQQAISKTVSTFKSLASRADFQTAADPRYNGADSTTPHPSARAEPRVATPPAPQTVTGPQPALHIDVQIHISSEATAGQIDQIFASMAKHLYQKSDG